MNAPRLYTGSQIWTALGSTPEIDVRAGRVGTVRRAQGPLGELVAVREGPADWVAAEVAGLRAHAGPGIVPVLDHGVTEDGQSWLAVPWYELNLRDWLLGAPPIERVLRALVLVVEAADRLPRHRLWKPESFLVDETDDLQVVLGDLGAANPAWRGDVDPGALLATIKEILGDEAHVRDRLTGRVSDAAGVARRVHAELGWTDVAALGRAQQHVEEAVAAWVPRIPKAPPAATRTPAVDPTQSAIFVVKRPVPPPPEPPPPRPAPAPEPPPSGSGLRMAILLVGIIGVALVGVIALTGLGIWGWRMFGGS